MYILPKKFCFDKVVLTAATTPRQLADIFRIDSDPDTYVYRIARLAHALRIDNAICKEFIADDDVEELAANAKAKDYIGAWHNAITPDSGRGCLVEDKRKGLLAYIAGQKRQKTFTSYPLSMVHALQYGLVMVPEDGLIATETAAVPWMRRLLYESGLLDFSVTRFPKPGEKAAFIALHSPEFLWADIVRVCRGIQLLYDLCGRYHDSVVCTGKFAVAWCSARRGALRMTEDRVKKSLIVAGEIGLLECDEMVTQRGISLATYRPARVIDGHGVHPNDLERFFTL